MSINSLAGPNAINVTLQDLPPAGKPSPLLAREPKPLQLTAPATGAGQSEPLSSSMLAVLISEQGYSPGSSILT